VLILSRKRRALLTAAGEEKFTRKNREIASSYDFIEEVSLWRTWWFGAGTIICAGILALFILGGI
jgi:hypothetical protein